MQPADPIDRPINLIDPPALPCTHRAGPRGPHRARRPARRRSRRSAGPPCCSGASGARPAAPDCYCLWGCACKKGKSVKWWCRARTCRTSPFVETPLVDGPWQHVQARQCRARDAALPPTNASRLKAMATAAKARSPTVVRGRVLALAPAPQSKGSFSLVLQTRPLTLPIIHSSPSPGTPWRPRRRGGPVPVSWL